MKKYFAILFILVGAHSVMAQMDTLHKKTGHMGDTTADGRPWWSDNDTTKFTPTGYIDASLGVVDVAYAFKNPTFSLAAAFPIKHSSFGIAGKLGYNSMLAEGASSSFTQYYLAVGGYFTFQLNTRYAFDVRLLGGLMYCHYPEQNFSLNTNYSSNSSYDSVVYYTFNVKSANAFSFIFQGGIGFRYRLSEKLGALLNIDYMLLRPVFNSTLTTSYTGATADRYNASTLVYSSQYTFPANSATAPYTFEPAASNGYTMFSLGIFYQLGSAALIK